MNKALTLKWRENKRLFLRKKSRILYLLKDPYLDIHFYLIRKISFLSYPMLGSYA